MKLKDDQHYNNLGIGCKYFNVDLLEGDGHAREKLFRYKLIYLGFILFGKTLNAELCANWVPVYNSRKKSFYSFNSLDKR